MRISKKAIFCIVILIGIVVLFRVFGIHEYLSFEALKSRRTEFMAHISRNYVRSILVYIALYMTIIACSIPSVAPLTMIGGFLFGVVPSIIYSLIGCTIGATVSFLAVRYMLGATIQERYGERLARFKEYMQEQSVSNLLILQLLTVVPYFVINTLAALGEVPLLTFIWTTAVGTLPALFIYSFAGKQLMTIQSPKDIVTLPVIGAMVLLILLAAMPIIIKRMRKWRLHRTANKMN